MGQGLQLSVGRVIAIGRLLLAALFMLAIAVSDDQQLSDSATSHMLFAGYLAFAAGVAATTWNNWSRDAKLAGLAHAIDIGLFTLLVPSVNGHSSPFITAFTFVLLAAAVRWGWRVTALSALLLILLYLSVSLLAVVSRTGLDQSLIAIRSGHLVILSLILTWFGANQGGSKAKNPAFLAPQSLDDWPLETGLRAAMDSVQASDGVLIWHDDPSGQITGLAIRNGSATIIDVPTDWGAQAPPETPFLYNRSSDKSLRRDEKRNLIAGSMHEIVPRKVASTLGLGEGLAIPVRSTGSHGALFLERVRGLSADHIEIGDEISTSIVAHVRAHELIKAAEENAEARSRLTLARDLHDSIVQFLAGAAFRLEAMKMAHSSGDELRAELDDLKHLFLQEQRELRIFITALRSGPMVGVGEIAKDLQSLADRLSRQWAVSCTLTARHDDRPVPTRIRLDAQQLVREAVANAVRHAKATVLTVEIATVSDEVRLEITNDGADFPLNRGPADMPVSLVERVKLMGGSIDVARGMGITRMSISLPIAGNKW